MERTDLRIVSYNCRGFNASKVPCISELLNMCDILFLKETWLYSSQFCLFTTYFTNYNNVSICGMGEFVIHAGRPYGGCTILYNSSCTEIYPIYFGDSKRTCEINWKLNNSEFVHLFTVYMPCDDNIAMHHHDFNHVLSAISTYCHECHQYNVEYCIIGGDFNTDISRVNSMNTTLLHNCVSDECLMFCMKSENCFNIDYTYCGPNQSISVIDHFIIYNCLSSSIDVYKTISSVSNISDHVPIFLDVEWPSPKSTNIFDTITYHIPIPLWARATQAQTEQYQSRLDFYLSNIVIPYTSLLCKDVLFLLVHLIWICFIRILLMHAYLPQMMPYLIVISLCHKTSINIYLVGHRNVILLENSHYSGTLYRMHVRDHGRVRLLM